MTTYIGNRISTSHVLNLSRPSHPFKALACKSRHRLRSPHHEILCSRPQAHAGLCLRPPFPTTHKCRRPTGHGCRGAEPQVMCDPQKKKKVFFHRRLATAPLSYMQCGMAVVGRWGQEDARSTILPRKKQNPTSRLCVTASSSHSKSTYRRPTTSRPMQRGRVLILPP
jgi:hypothetical protein